VSVDLDMNSDLEQWIMIKNGMEFPTSTEVDSMTVKTTQRFIGFELGQQEKSKREQEREARKAKMSRGGR